MDSTFFIDNKEYNRSLDQVVDKIELLINNNNFLYQNKFLTDKILTIYRNSLEQIKINNKIIENIILEFCYKSELNAAFSSDIFFDFLISCFKEKISKEQIEKFNENIKTFKRKYNKKDLDEILIESINNKLISSIVLEALNLAGVDGKIIPSKSNNDDYSVELVLGYNFKIPPYMEFISNEQWNQHNVRILIVDGIIERESEIHNLLMENIEEKSPLLIVARGFGEEVLATLSANRQREILNVVPVRVPYETNFINMPTDIAISCGGIIITPFKGDLLSSKKLSDLPIIHQVLINKTGIQIINPDNVELVRSHLNSLIQKKEESKEQDIIDLIDQRISCFSVRSVNIKLKKGTDKEKMVELENIDYALRLHKDSFQNGIISSDELIKISNLNIKKFNLKSIKSIFSGINYAFNCFTLLKSINGMVISDNSFSS